MLGGMRQRHLNPVLTKVTDSMGGPEGLKGQGLILAP